MLIRALDILVAVTGLVLFAPVMIVVAVLVRVQSRGPAIYAAARIGRGGRAFRMFKFRSMVVDADRHGPLVTAGGDPRITPLGRYLRRTKLDELPSLWNVLVGDMSVVGPRPENPRCAALYNDAQRRVLSVRPGLTSPATMKYRNEETLLAGVPDLDAAYADIMQDKLRIEIDYLDRRTVLTDVAVLLQTIRSLLRSPRGFPDA